MKSIEGIIEKSGDNSSGILHNPKKTQRHWRLWIKWNICSECFRKGLRNIDSAAHSEESDSEEGEGQDGIQDEELERHFVKLGEHAIYHDLREVTIRILPAADAA
jgi:hypothetical protein